jgi:hypothetical protein
MARNRRSNYRNVNKTSAPAAEGLPCAIAFKSSILMLSLAGHVLAAALFCKMKIAVSNGLSLNRS